MSRRALAYLGTLVPLYLAACGGAEFQSFPDDVDAGADVVVADVLSDADVGRGDVEVLVDAPTHTDAATLDAGVDAAPPALDANVAPDAPPPPVCCNISPPSSMFAGCPWSCYADASTCELCPLGAVCRWVDPNTGDGWLGKVTPCP